MKLTAEKVNKIFVDCLFTDEETKDGAPGEYIMVQGVVNDFGLHPERTESHQEEIISLLQELPDEFKKSDGGGWSFLNACNDRQGNQWTGLHRDMEQLFVLGMAIKKAEFQLPKVMWRTLPGGMPYLVVDV